MLRILRFILAEDMAKALGLSEPAEVHNLTFEASLKKDSEAFIEIESKPTRH